MFNDLMPCVRLEYLSNIYLSGIINYRTKYRESLKSFVGKLASASHHELDITNYHGRYGTSKAGHVTRDGQSRC